MGRVRPPVVTDEALVKAWNRWARHPRDKWITHRLEDEVQRVAGEYGITGSALRDAVTEELRKKPGLKTDTAVKAVLTRLSC